MAAYLSTTEDANEAIKLLLEFHKMSEVPFETSAAWANALFRACVNDDDKVAISKKGGILLGGVSQSLLGPFKQAYEIVWWVSPSHRGNSLEMIKLYENWAKSKGAKIIELKSLNKFKETERIYTSLNYKPLETSWVKNI